MDYIPLEKPIADLETRINELRQTSSSTSLDLRDEIRLLEEQLEALRLKMFSNLNPYERVQLSRHPHRPNTLELIALISDSFIELHGDRNFLEDKAIVAGLARINGRSVVFIGHQKGRGTKDNIERNFGMPRPEGYRKALRIMSMAERFGLPIISFIDTPGAYPGIGAEERGQSEAIGKNIFVMARIKVPVVAVVTGEGGSGGALAIGVANRVHMLSYATYSVISPEGCASILMKDATKADEAARMLKLTADSALSLKIIDSVIEEPLGGAHRNPAFVAEEIKKVLVRDLNELTAMSGDALREQRQDKFLNMGEFAETKH
ncbi:MAG: acetyl-CoA carboxylase carboxyltransferase subunit alpha [Oligoflexales bacterium]|nr:acetyl-CoA carboxylase carboxyltransferase subunit alpha [Oligoflexales bacterium]